MIALINLKLRNFLSHKETEIAFNKNQKLLIDGNSGSGKSSILEGIIWAFYGTGRSNNTTLVHRGSEKAIVELTLDHDGTEVIINRVIAAKGKHTLTITIDGVAHPKTGVRELQEWIETDLTGASYLLFVNSVAYLQGGADNFVTQPAGKRKELLLEIVKTIDFDTYYEKVKVKIGEEELKEVAIDTMVENSTRVINEAGDKLKKQPEVEGNLQILKEKWTALDISRVTLESWFEGQKEVVDKMKTLKEEISANDVNILQIDGYLHGYKETIETLKDESYLSLWEIEDLQTEKKELEAKLLTVDTSITTVATHNEKKVELTERKPVDLFWESTIEKLVEENTDILASGTCPSGNDCPHFANSLLRVEKNKKEIDLNKELFAKFGTDMAKWQSEWDAFVELPLSELTTEKEGLQKSILMLTTKIEGCIQAEANKEKLDDAYTQLAIRQKEKEGMQAKSLEQAKEMEVLLKSVDGTHEDKTIELHGVKLDMAANEKQRSVLERELGVLDGYSAQIPEEQAKLDEAAVKKEIISLNLSRLGLLKDAFGSKGIKSLVIDYLLPELEEKINDILSKMSEFRVTLDTQQEKASGEGNKEGLFITIVNEMGEEMPFENYSGGERLKIVVAITEALATLQKCGFRLFDEVWVGLDETSLESFVGVLDTLLERFPQVVCVSHLTEIKAAFEDKITIIKHNGISYDE